MKTCLKAFKDKLIPKISGWSITIGKIKTNLHINNIQSVIFALLHLKPLTTDLAIHVRIKHAQHIERHGKQYTSVRDHSNINHQDLDLRN